MTCAQTPRMSAPDSHPRRAARAFCKPRRRPHFPSAPEPEEEPKPRGVISCCNWLHEIESPRFFSFIFVVLVRGTSGLVQVSSRNHTRKVHLRLAPQRRTPPACGSASSEYDPTWSSVRMHVRIGVYILHIYACSARVRAVATGHRAHAPVCFGFGMGFGACPT